MSKPFSLSKYERLKSKKDIDTLFLTGKAFFVFPFKIFYKLLPLPEGGAPVQIGVSVPKKLFKRAVDRNLIKRKVREIYRINKVDLNKHLRSQQQQLQFMWVYLGKEAMTSAEIHPVVLHILERMKKEI